MPIVSSPFKGNIFSKSAHFETVLPALFRQIILSYERERLELLDGDFIDLDWIKQGNSKLLVLFHGLEGSSQSTYIKGFARFFSKHGYDICAVNFRSCSGGLNRLLRSYHSGATADIHEVLQHLVQTKSYVQINLIGFSLGGNVLLKYLGEGFYKLPEQVESALAFSVPIDLAASAIKLASWQNKMYMQRFLKSLNTKIIEKSKMFPGALDIKAIHSIKTFSEWDNKFTAPIHGFLSSEDYYSKCSSLQFLKNIAIPTLLVNAKNDPFLPSESFPEQKYLSGQVTFEVATFGGHCGFSVGFPNGSYYSEMRALEFLSNK